MDYAIDMGINFFDTAEMYAVPPKKETQGSTEKIIGSWFKERKCRDKVILATKVSGRSPLNWLRDEEKSTEQSREQIFEAVDKSLIRLGLDYIDQYNLTLVLLGFYRLLQKFVLLIVLLTFPHLLANSMVIFRILLLQE